MLAAPLAVFTRGTVDESTHCGSIAVVDADGRVVASVGNPHRLTTMRSTAKPFQTMAVVESGAADRFEMAPADIAVIAASHSGEPRHTDAVQRLLARAGLTVAALQTGTHPPLHGPTRMALEQRGESLSPLHHNCSGKHAGMLCACVHHGWDHRTYLRPDHPMQRAVLRLVSDMVGVRPQEVATAIDGCGVPTFAVPLVAIARGFARLAEPRSIAPPHAAAAARVRAAMLAHPEMVAGEGRLDTDLMALASGRVLAKAGAEACYGVSLVERGWGVAVKIEDGNPRATPIAVVEALRQLGALTDSQLDALAGYARPLVRNYRGEVVGEGRPVFALVRE